MPKPIISPAQEWGYNTKHARGGKHEFTDADVRQQIAAYLRCLPNHTFPAADAASVCSSDWTVLKKETKNKVIRTIPNYPSEFFNFEKLPLNGAGLTTLFHIPVMSASDFKKNNKQNAGIFRAAYRVDHPYDYEIIYHDKTLPKRPNAKHHPFSMAKRLAVPTAIDKSVLNKFSLLSL